MYTIKIKEIKKIKNIIETVYVTFEVFFGEGVVFTAQIETDEMEEEDYLRMFKLYLTEIGKEMEVKHNEW